MRPSPLLLLAALAACSTSTGPDVTGTPAGDVAPTITHQLVQVAGGRPRITVVVIDSAAGTWEEASCDGVSRLTDCSLVSRRTGAVGSPFRADLWQTVTSAEFRALRPTYGFSGGVVPPDVSQATLIVVANGRRWQVSYDTRATIPGVLSRLECRLLAARGALILCA